ncbi:hypothetical protein B0H19DRAFT_1207732 [Mycena capillaripes]|nr:hypothetical protein B0H19DRAFT_1207732 [Mycena capillaripes]
MSTNLCLACSSSLPPKFSEKIFTTPCCSRPICPPCIAANSRLARYNPCLACLGGVGVVGAGASTNSFRQPETTSRNVDGAVRDEDTFVVGDDDDEEMEPSDPSPQSPAVPASAIESSAPPSKYYIKRGDTLQGIALRFGLDASGRALCRLNNLPPSTLSTTPHILHTRAFLTLPPSAHAKLQPSDAAPDNAEERAREVSRARERAGKRLQTLTKEVDWRVARAYIALADDPDEAATFARKQKELGASAAAPLEAVAVDRYLDDLEWEAEQLRAGKAARILPYPIRSEKGLEAPKRAW